ncbi:MAG: hypothetical protein CMB97_00360 [Flavobacteriaceae bacterium]|nr:hypothetical protein [Flavobacteriaceae bacterium]
MTISVLIATCNRLALLRQCIHSILKNTRLPDEIIIIDQSTDAVIESIHSELESLSPVVRYHHVSWKGKTKSLNAAIAKSTCEFLALTDDDVIVEEKWLETFIEKTTKYPDIDTFCGQVLPETNSNPEGYLNLVLGDEERWINQTTNPLSPGFCGANIFIKKETLIQAGCYNILFGPGAPFRNNDDGELAYRLVKMGREILFSPELYVHHSSWRNEKDNTELMHNYAFGIGAFAGYYMRNSDFKPIVYLLRKLIAKIMKLVWGIIRFKQSIVLENWIHINGFLSGSLCGLTPNQNIKNPN